MKARFLALAALVLGMVSCQQDFAGGNNYVGGEVDFQLAVGAEELATRAGADRADDTLNDKDSAYGAIDYLQGADWSAADLRYSLEVWDVDDAGNVIGTEPVKDRMVKIVPSYEKVVFDLRLIPKRKYRFVVFADFVPEGTVATDNVDDNKTIGLHHNIGDTLADITIKEGANTNATGEFGGLNNELTDAYFQYMDITINNSNTQTMDLKRPYGKLRVVTTDLHLLNLNVEPKSVTVAYTAKHPQTFNALTGAIGAIESDVIYSFNAEYNAGVCKNDLANHYYTAGYDSFGPNGEHKYISANGDERHTHMTLFTDYILADTEQTPYQFQMTVFDADGVKIKETDFSTDIPVQRNYLTTVIGDVLTTATHIDVVINDNFENGIEWNPEEDVFDIYAAEEPMKDLNGEYTLTHIKELTWIQAQIAKGNTLDGEVFNLTTDIDLNGHEWVPIGNDTTPFEGTINGNGHTISGLVINRGEGTRASTEDLYAYGFISMSKGATIKALNFENVDIDIDGYVGAVVGYAIDTVIEDITVSGIVTSNGYAAGIVFEGENITMKNCTNDATVSSGRGAGIIAWAAGNNTFENVTNNGDITGTISAAGIANRFVGTMKNAVNYGNIKGDGTEACGGIVGTQLGATTYEYCFNYGSVKTSKDNANSSAAGILGHTPGTAATFNYCANFGDIIAEQSYAAGIGYSLYGHVKANYCYNAGAVNGADGAGAIAPKAQYGANDTANYCLNAGAITSSNGKVYQGSNKNTSSYYYNGGVLYNVKDNTEADVNAALAVLNGGADAEFFTLANGVIVVE